MRTKDIITLLNDDKEVEVSVNFIGNAIYSRSCKVQLPAEHKWIASGIGKSDIFTDFLKVNIEIYAYLDSEDIDEFLNDLSSSNSLEASIDWLEDKYSYRHQDTDFDYSDPWEIHNAMEIDLSFDPSHPHEHLSHYLEDDKHTFTPKEEYIGYFDYKYVDNWVEFDGTKVRLEENGDFKKWIRKEGALSSYAEDPFTFSGFAVDKERDHGLCIGEKIMLNEKQTLMLAKAYCTD